MTKETTRTAPLSSLARERLAGALKQREAVATRANEIKAAEARIAGAIPTDAAAEAELAALDSAASHALADWARVGAEGEPPNPNSDRRQELLRRVTDAQARARVVESARTALNVELNDESRRLSAIDNSIEPIVIEVLFDQAAPMVEEFRRLEAAASAIAWRVTQLKSFAVEMAHTAIGEAREKMFVRLPELIAKTDGIHPPNTLDGHEGIAARAEWLVLASRLRAGDANAKLEASS